MKTCKQCKIPKTLEKYPKSKFCKDGREHVCKQCKQPKQKERYLKNIDINKEYYINNKEDFKKRNLNTKETRKRYHSKHKDKITKYLSEYHKFQRKNNIPYKLLTILRGRLYQALQGNIKLETTKNLLGCDINMFKQHIEKQFTKEMSWENYGKIWEIDHIKPCSSFDLTKLEEQQKCFHYTNMQPLFKTTKIAESLGYKNYIGNRDKKDII